MRKNNSTTIYYIVDSRREWVPHRRLRYLKQNLHSFRFVLLSAKEFQFLWKTGFLKRKYIYFTSWRISHALLKKDPNMFSGDDYKYFMAAVTSHSNIGGGLDPLNPIPGRSPEEAFRIAGGILGNFKVVTANSMILYELLNKAVPGVIYCPNGVDVELFRPLENKKYNPSDIRIGWVGKVRGPKNFQVIEEASKMLEALGSFKVKLIKILKEFKRSPFSFNQMKDFYNDIDFYLCASLNEGTPNPALESGACGIPLVTTRVGNMRELISPEQNGYFVEPTAESIVKQFSAIRKMSPERYFQMSRNIRESITNDWSWDIRINNFKEAFNKLAGD